jgi:PilZ domain-containing protein
MARDEANRRRYRRIPAPIHCRPAGEEFFAQRLEPVDISFGGLRTYSDEEYRVGSFLRLDIFFSGVAPVTLNTEVMWIKSLGKRAPARFELGLAFVDLKPDARNVLRRLFSQAEKAERASSTVAARPALAPQPPLPDLTLEFTPTEPVSEVRPVTPQAASGKEVADSSARLARIPMVLVNAQRLQATKLDARAGFLLALIDGVTSVEGVLDVSGMPAEETLELLEDLRRRGIIALH